MDVHVGGSPSPRDERRSGRREVVDADVGALDPRPMRVNLAPWSAAHEDGHDAGVGGLCVVRRRLAAGSEQGTE